MYKLIYSPKALKDAKKLKKSYLNHKCEELLDIIAQNPYQNPPCYEKLIGDLDQAFSRRLNVQHRLVYEIDEKNRIISVLKMWSRDE